MKARCANGVTLSLSTPIGPLSISGCEEGLHFVDRVCKQFTSKPDLLVKCNVFDVNDENLPTPVQQCIEWFRNYFTIQKNLVITSNPVLNGHYPPICPHLGLTKFSLKVYTNVASNVTFGNRISYGELAELIKSPKASRAVGTALKNNPFTIVIPCHRVVPKSGGVGSYGGGTDCAPLKEWLLTYEKAMLSD